MRPSPQRTRYSQLEVNLYTNPDGSGIVLRFNIADGLFETVRQSGRGDRETVLDTFGAGRLDLALANLSSRLLTAKGVTFIDTVCAHLDANHAPGCRQFPAFLAALAAGTVL